MAKKNIEYKTGVASNSTEPTTNKTKKASKLVPIKDKVDKSKLVSIKDKNPKADKSKLTDIKDRNPKKVDTSKLTPRKKKSTVDTSNLNRKKVY